MIHAQANQYLPPKNGYNYPSPSSPGPSAQPRPPAPRPPAPRPPAPRPPQSRPADDHVHEPGKATL